MHSEYKFWLSFWTIIAVVVIFFGVKGCMEVQFMATKGYEQVYDPTSRQFLWKKADHAPTNP